ncbi:MAG: L,D-transpeptidase family protein [Deltaproteobacteria bacterium]|nr:L,D-transpeptidase family protein [Deltaproteobacteria bacterium]
MAFSLALLGAAWAPALAQEEGLWPDAILDPGDEPGIILVVDKGRQELRIYRRDGRGGIVLEKVIPCSTGMVQGDKLIRGDKKTPSGYYVFNQKLLPRELPEIYGVLAYPMDYPNFWDRTIGRGGDGIWTHGINKPLVDYDSNGCVELFNHDIAALEERIGLYDTPILLYEELALASRESLAREARAVRAFVEKWRAAWAGKDLATYGSLYSANFANTEGLSFQAWMSHKANVAEGYREIEIELENVRVFRHRDVIVVSFRQRYRGDSRYESVGDKRLYLRPKGDSYEVVAEEFVGNPPVAEDKWLSPEQRYAALNDPPLAVASLSQPLVAASAGAIEPGSHVLALASASGGLNADSTQDELDRADLEARARGLSPLATATSRSSAPGQDDGPEPELGPGEILVAEAGSFALSHPEARTSSGAPAAPIPPPSPTNPTVKGLLTAPPGPEDDPLPALPGPEAESPPEAPPVATPAAATPEAAAALESSGESPGAPSGAPAPPGETGETLVASLEPAAADPLPAAVADPAPEPGAPPRPASPVDRRAALLSWLEAWARSWEAKDNEAFFAFYAEDFYFPDKNMFLPAFKKYKGRLLNNAKTIQVELVAPEISWEGEDRAVIAFRQIYESDNYRDEGVKTLFAREKDGQWKITAETFEANS